MSSDDDSNNQFGVSRKIMLFAVFSLLAVVLLIIFLHIYSRYILRRQEMRRRATINRLARQINASQDSGDDHQAPQNKGLDPLIISSLPMFPYKRPIISTNNKNIDHDRDNDHDNIECTICLGTIGENVMVKVLPNCKHMFHVQCIDMWLGSNLTCPICRTVAEPMVQQHEINGSSHEAQPSAPPLGEGSSSSLTAAATGEKGGGSSSSRFGSFRWMVGRERSSRIRSSCGDEIEVDIERQS